MATPTDGNDLVYAVALLAAGVVAVPLFKRLGLGAVLGYLCAGLTIGPFGLKLFSNPDSILHVAELGVVMFLFLIGIEMQPSRLWRMRKDIFGLGALQVSFCGSLLTMAGFTAGIPLTIAFIGSMGFVLSSTAIVMQILEEKGKAATAPGQRIISTLLLEDLSIVPLLAIVAFLSPFSSGEGFNWLNALIAVGAVASMVAAGIWLLNPLFAILASSGAREVMTAAALLVVLGAALLMELSGLSMAMGAFMAGVLLSESSFRHQLEIDIEPFRGILLGLFFMAVGMSLDIKLVLENWVLIATAALSCMFLKSLGVYLAARSFGINHREAFFRGALLTQGGEFAFVLYAAATAAGIFDARTAATLSATVIISMALTPVVLMLQQRIIKKSKVDLKDIDLPEELSNNILLIGFGRFGQMVSQPLLAKGYDLSIIETDAKLIRIASTFGVKVYYGDGTRLDVLQASGAKDASMILVCVTGTETTNKIVNLIKTEFPATKIFARAYDRGHALELVHAGVDYQIRETFESAMAFSKETLLELGVDAEEIDEIIADTRQRDNERFQIQMTAGIYAGNDLLRGNTPVPAPLVKPEREGQIFDQSDQDIVTPSNEQTVSPEATT
ncbi:monovalent cation:proton antiporter-2 (CPA2) family protein [Microvirga sp. W0021]|uniref:Monovalent cation:proton antiporter-2 (CPA2) family protein n=1 Tax=Hohaiivirga grylli TaxID=3133970 RepID=A0ABV0BG43_9HYPH